MQKSNGIGRMTHVIAAALAVTAVGAMAAGAKAPSITTVDEIAPLLPAKPTGLGRSAVDRAAWKAVAKTDGYRGIVDEAAKILGAALPDQFAGADVGLPDLVVLLHPAAHRRPSGPSRISPVCSLLLCGMKEKGCFCSLGVE